MIQKKLIFINIYKLVREISIKFSRQKQLNLISQIKHSHPIFIARLRLKFVYQIKIMAAYISSITYQIILILIWQPQFNQITGQESSQKAR